MIKANKSPVFEFIFERYNRWLIRRRFDSVLLKGETGLLSQQDSLPIIFCVNHSSWWDGLVAYLLSRRFHLNGYWMMEEKQLKNLRPFTWLGAFSVVREDAREAAASIKYAINVLKGKRETALWIFPQGEILPNDVRPIRFFSGIQTIAERVSPCIVVPIALRYEFLGNYKPSIFINIGSPISIMDEAECGKLMEDLEAAVTALLDETLEAIKSTAPIGYKNILA